MEDLTAGIDVVGLSQPNFTDFYEDSRQKVFRALALTLRNQDLAADAVEEAMARAYERWRSVSGYLNQEGWIFRVGLNWEIGSTRSSPTRLRLPGPIPAKEFWSVVVYDLWTRSTLANGQAFPSLNSYSPSIESSPDGGVDIYIGPEPPEGKEGNWIRTLPDVGWFPLIRLYGPLEPWIEESWKPDDLTPIDD